MPRLTHRQYRLVLENIRRLYAETSVAALRRRMVIDLRRLVPADYIAFNLVLRGSNAKVIERFADPDPPLAQSLLPAFNAHCREHPFVTKPNDRRAPGARKLSDYLDQTQLQATGLFNEYYRKLGTRFQMYFPFDTGGRQGLGITLNRGMADFDDLDRAILDLLLPHYRQAYLNASALEQTRCVCPSVSDGQPPDGEGTLIARHGGTVEWVCDRAFSFLLAYLDTSVEAGRLLPEPLRSWCEGGQVAVERTTVPLRLTTNRGTLVLRVVARRENQTIILIRERPFAGKANPICTLTSREREVLSWVAQAKSNAEIAVILGLSVLTVGKHLENIFAKLGVENRTAAMRLFLDHQRGD
jgi:DNA-binding CsgD family transcriptional regulator